MKIILLILVFILSGCGFLYPKQDTKIANLPPAVAKTNACFVLYDLKTEKFVEIINKDQCQKRLPACSTFKIPLAVMAFDQGILRNSLSTPYEWDGVQRMVPAWNKNHNGKTWMQDSVVWFSQRMTKDMGRKKVQEYLNKFDYGNRDFSGGLEDAWLTSGSKTSVLISAIDQIKFMKALYLYRLPVSLNAMTMTQNLIPYETSPRGSVLSGKTGSGFLGKNSQFRLGWYVANLKSNADEYLSVFIFEDTSPQEKPGFGGPLAKETMKQILAEKGLW